MKILVTGSEGYIGSVLTKKLEELGHEIIGYDIGYYSDCIISKVDENFKKIKKDLRDVEAEDLKHVDAIIHLAGLSNDPLGEFQPSLTEEINYSATLKVAKLAKRMGVERFIYASSQSMYGVALDDAELDEDNSEKNPITAYAKTKWLAEIELKKICSDDFTVVCFRPSTVFGASPRLRCDIVFNNFVACAYTTGKIEIKSDGTPWRPIVHVEDVCEAFIAGINAPKSIVSGKSYNIGVKNGNYTVKDIAEAATNSVKGSSVIYTGEHGKDSRTYKVSFNKIFKELGIWYKPKWNLDDGGLQLVEFFKENKFLETDFRGLKTNRLVKLKSLIEDNKLDNNLKLKKL
jgi:nucleoside-diphosphate-sugar epimerase